MAKVKLLDPADSKRRLDRYELIGELASGGMATVFLARLAGAGGFQRLVAIKRLHPHLASESEFIEMFLDEARLAAGIHHPHVVPILEIGRSDAGYYLVMEYIEGDTVGRIVARAVTTGRPTPQPILLRIMLDALAGLHAAHELTDARGQRVNLVHRDCSPQNILVGVDGSARITDFGIAHASSRIASTRTDRVKGKLAYMSPEQAQGDGEIDRRSDLFSMGVILWEVLVGRRLFKADTETTTLRRLVIDPIPRISALIKGVHPALDAACARALDRDPSRRFQTASEMSDALERAAHAMASASTRDSGVASPRDVASYVLGALEQDIAAQRESVRAWLAHGEPSLASTSASKVSPDITLKLALDRPLRPSEKHALPPSAPPSRTPTPGPLPKTLIGEAAVAGRITYPQIEIDVAPMPEELDDENETELMLRGDFRDPTPVASSRVRPRSPNWRAQAIALVIGALLVLVGLKVWTRARARAVAASRPNETQIDAIEARIDPPAATPAPLPAPPLATADADHPPAPGPVLTGKHTGKRAPPPARAPSTGASSSPAAPRAPPPAPAGEDLANPYR